MLYKNSDGIVYAASGKKFQQECIRSINSLRSYNSEIPVAVFTDSPDAFSCLPDLNLEIIVFKACFGYRDKIEAISRSPFQKTLFLDSDTILLQNPAGIFEILDRFDIAITTETYTPSENGIVPRTFPEFNTGVVALNSSSPSVKNFLKDWLETFTRDFNSSNRPKHDQPSFRESLYRSSLRFCTISNEWNFHVTHPLVLNAGAQIIILHSRLKNDDIQRQGSAFYKASRIFFPTASSIHPDRFGSMNRKLDLWLRILSIPFRIWARIFR